MVVGGGYMERSGEVEIDEVVMMVMRCYNGLRKKEEGIEKNAISGKSSHYILGAEGG